MPPPLGLFGGTFDPVHNGHLRVALDALELLPLRQVRFIPSARPPHRNRPGADPAQRRRLLELAIADEPGFAIDDRELERDGPSYTVDTLSAIRAEQPRASLCLLLGQDAFAALPTWHRWRQLTDLAHLVVLTRPGYPLAASGELARLLSECGSDDAADLRRSVAGRVFRQNVTPLALSATELRQRLAAGRNLRYLTPTPVCAAIERERLYLCPHP